MWTKIMIFSRWVWVAIAKRRQILSSLKEIKDVYASYKDAREDKYISKAELQAILNEIEEAVRSINNLIGKLL